MDPWHIVENALIFEDDNYILLAGPAFYEDNGGTIEYLGSADILFEKNPDSRYGVTLLYGRYREAYVDAASVETSSELPKSGNKTYAGSNLIDGDYTTIWSEGVSGTGVGETITIHLKNIQLVYGVVICNGYTASFEQYTNNGLITDVEVDFGDGATVEVNDIEGYAYEGYTSENLVEANSFSVELEEPVMTDTITITIKGAKKGTKYEDTCVSEVSIYGL